MSLLAVRAPRAQADVSGFPKMIGLTVDNAPAIELCHRYEAMSAEAGHNVTAADIPFFRCCYLAETEEKARDEAYRPLNRGEAHHALKNALRIGRQGEIRDRSSEGQHYRMAGLNLLAAIVIYWNTAHLGEAVGHRKHAGLTVEPELLAHISPLGWAHILLTGEYRWPKRR